MGQVFGRNGVAEPAYEVLYHRASDFSYEIRKYGTRFAAHTVYNSTGGGGGGGGGGDDKPFMDLARYIGVFGTPENEGQKAISMTAPVIVDTGSGGAGGKPVPIAMTAPVVISSANTNDTTTTTTEKTMEFLLPAEYDSMDKIPVPTNPRVTIVELPPSVGAVHRFAGSMSDTKAKDMAQHLADQLQKDGASGASNEYVMSHYQYWGYNPPFTLPMYRRNEIWVPLDPAMVQDLVGGGSTALPKN
jgi:SOUL heme-binding protein